MTRVVAVVQARMGSQRFPGKMLAKLGNQTLLAWVLTRVMSANLIDETILATSSSAQDDDLVADAEKFGVRIVRGSESDVLSRFNLALEKLMLIKSFEFVQTIHLLLVKKLIA